MLTKDMQLFWSKFSWMQDGLGRGEKPGKRACLVRSRGFSAWPCDSPWSRSDAITTSKRLAKFPQVQVA
ncbi:hypothetical protein WJX79_007586 [Trebouxia sp. C0005]